MIRKALILIPALILLGLVYIGAKNYPKLGVVTGYAAKKMCSCTFIAERDHESIQNEDLGMSPLSLSSTKIDHSKKTATSSIFGIQSRTAVYRGKLGCILLHGEDDYDVKYPKTDNPKPNLSNVQFPYGDKVDLAKMSNVDYNRLNKAVIEAFDPEFAMNNLKTRSLLVMHKDSIIAEQYANGYDKDTEILGWSMTKSIMNTWIGTMVMKGQISIEDKSLFEEWKSDKRKNITLNNLLHMNSGLSWSEVYDQISPATKMLYESEDIVKTAINRDMEAEIGEHWEYSSGTSNIISGYLRSKFENHDDYLRYPYEQIFSKLNMNHTTMETDESGNYIGSSYCYATTRDWARYGTLYLRDGVWNGERILPEGWVDYSRKTVEDSNGIYSAHFWTNENGAGYKDAPYDLYSANGYEGQRVFIIPSKDLVIVRMGLNQNFDFNQLLKEICASIA